MNPAELDIGDAAPSPRARPRKAAIEALERLLRAQVALSEHRDQEGSFGLLRPARDDEIDLIEAVFGHCGVPLPDTLRAIYRRTLGVGNPVSALPVLAVPFLRAALPDEGFGCPLVGLAAFEEALGLDRDEAAFERPPFLHLGHAAPLGLTVSRNGLWSLRDYQGHRGLPEAQEFNLVFEAAFCAYVDQVLLLWANDLAGDVMKRRDLTQGARLEELPSAVWEARAHLVAPRTLGSKVWGEVQPLDHPDLLRASRRDEAPASSPVGRYVTVVGLPYGDHPDLARGIGLRTLLRLCPVDDNPHDANAVEVWHDGEVSTRVGFVTRAEAPGVRTLPGGASAWRLRVIGRSDQALYAELEVLRPEKDSSDGGSRSVNIDESDQDLFTRGT
jgi:hypothetical protein